MKKTQPFVIGAKFEDDIVLDTVCKKCGFNKSECICNAKKELLEPNKHNLYLKHEKRNGKIVTIVGEFFMEA
ncbi:MAG: hypothetical protein HXX81_03070, partial [Campylobacterales bacterium]|nr:hypothetical protein [Campylobacterales bacterium]